MRRRKDGERSLRCFHNRDPVTRPQCDRVTIHCAAKFVLLPASGSVLPAHARSAPGAESAQPGVVLVCNRWLVRFRNHFLAKKRSPTIDGELQLPGEEPQRNARERDFESRAIRCHFASRNLIRRRVVPNLLWLARQIRVRPFYTGNTQRRVPKCVPFLFFKISRIHSSELPQRRQLLFGDSPLGGRHLELRLQFAAQHKPLARLFAYGKFMDQRLPVDCLERRPRSDADAALPLELDTLSNGGCPQSRLCFITREIAVHGKC